MFGLGAPIFPTLEFPFGALGTPPIAEQFGPPNPTPPSPMGALDHHQGTREAHMLDVEGPQRLGDTSISNPQ